jgi:hypothetical protein
MAVKMDTISHTRRRYNITFLNVEIYMIFKTSLYMTLMSVCKYLPSPSGFISRYIIKTSANNKKPVMDFDIYVVNENINKTGCPRWNLVVHQKT